MKTFEIYDGRKFFYQWDTGRKLIVNNPSITEVHFCYSNTQPVYSVIVNTEMDSNNNSIKSVTVPDELLQQHGVLMAYGYIDQDGPELNNSEYTQALECFDVVAKPKPTHYEPTIQNWIVPESRIANIENSIIAITNRLNEIENK